MHSIWYVHTHIQHLHTHKNTHTHQWINESTRMMCLRTEHNVSKSLYSNVFNINDVNKSKNEQCRRLRGQMFQIFLSSNFQYALLHLLFPSILQIQCMCVCVCVNVSMYVRNVWVCIYVVVGRCRHWRSPFQLLNNQNQAVLPTANSHQLSAWWCSGKIVCNWTSKWKRTSSSIE